MYVYCIIVDRTRCIHTHVPSSGLRVVTTSDTQVEEEQEDSQHGPERDAQSTRSVASGTCVLLCKYLNTLI